MESNNRYHTSTDSNPIYVSQNTPVYAPQSYYVDYARSPLVSSTMPVVMPNVYQQYMMYPNTTNLHHNSMPSNDQMGELPEGMRSPSGAVPEKVKRAISSNMREKMEKSLASMSVSRAQEPREIPRERTGDFLKRRYSLPAPPMRDSSLRRERSRLSTHPPRISSQRSLTAFQILNSPSSKNCNITAMALDKQLSLELQQKIAKAKAYRDFRTIEVLFLQLVPDTIRLAKDQYANFVIQRIIESANPGLVDQMIEYIKFDILSLATHQYGCRVLQRIVMYSSNTRREQLVNDILKESMELLQSKFGSYVLQTIIENIDSAHLKSFTKEHLEPSFYELCIDQYGSHILQHVFRFYKAQDKVQLSELIIGSVLELCNDQHANYVVQKMIYYGNRNVRSRVIEKILPHVLILCCTKAGSNVLERCLQTADQEESQQILSSVVQDQNTLEKIIKDKYGNYVIQKMLKILPYEQRAELSNVLIEYFEQLEENPKPNSFENFVYQVVMDRRPKRILKEKPVAELQPNEA